jgi:hypothetical protein
MQVDSSFKASGNFDNDDVIKQSALDIDEPVVLRVLGIMVQKSEVWYKGLFTDRETGEVRVVPRMVKMPLDFPKYGFQKEPTVFDGLINFDIATKRKYRTAGPGDTNKIKSIWQPRQIYCFPVIDRSDEEPVIKILEVSWQAYDLIKKLQMEKDPEDSTKLNHGPIWVGDIVLTKKEGTNPKVKLRQFNIKYTVSSARTNRMAGKIPTTIFNQGKPKEQERMKQLLDNAVSLGIFTAEEFTLIQEYDEQELIARYRPNTPEEIVEIIQNMPIALDATDEHGNLILPHYEEYLPHFEQLQIEYSLLENSNIPTDINDTTSPMNAPTDKTPSFDPDNKDVSDLSKTTSEASEQTDKESPSATTAEKSKGSDEASNPSDKENKPKTEAGSNDIPAFLRD